LIAVDTNILVYAHRERVKALKLQTV